ncbi:MAG: carboxymuconolactone decarboxylase family protein [Nitriliruptorales bacterium]|nr:carboxymuconolactone decarboxylase family protein [Nitriliruptorales bacterium]
MAFIGTIDESEATGRVAETYEYVREALGYIPDYAKVFMARPDVWEAWRSLIGAVVADMDRRRYELATLAAAQELRSSYCSLAHGKILRDRFMSADELQTVVRDRENAGLDEVDVAVMDLAEKVAADAYSVTQADIDRLRDLGLDDEEIAEVVYAAAARSFFSKVLDGLGAQPDAVYRELEPELQDVLTVGRPIAES